MHPKRDRSRLRAKRRSAAVQASKIVDQLGPFVVAVPVKDEEDRIAACLQALDAQIGQGPDHIVLLLNNCTDNSRAVAESLRPAIAARLHVIDVLLPPELANAGHARGLALEAAARLAGDTGVLATTDADGRVDPDWVDGNVAALRAGADAVAGWAELDPSEWGAIPVSLHEDDARECAYDIVCDEIHALLDPDPSDPWPRHTQASGASIAVEIGAYRAAGGLPRVPAGEDRAFIAALKGIDAKVRHAPECRVVVSGRIQGRAKGGMADTIRRRLAAPDPFLDDRLEPALDCARRAVLKRVGRAAYSGATRQQDWWSAFHSSEADILAALDAPTFGAAWENLERGSPALQRRKVAIGNVAAEHAIALSVRDAARKCPRAIANMLVQTRSYERACG
jgi:glycosyltransferase involved in cell wall biosynthesis